MNVMEYVIQRFDYINTAIFFAAMLFAMLTIGGFFVAITRDDEQIGMPIVLKKINIGRAILVCMCLFAMCCALLVFAPSTREARVIFSRPDPESKAATHQIEKIKP